MWIISIKKRNKGLYGSLKERMACRNGLWKDDKFARKGWGAKDFAYHWVDSVIATGQSLLSPMVCFKRPQHFAQRGHFTLCSVTSQTWLTGIFQPNARV